MLCVVVIMVDIETAQRRSGKIASTHWAFDQEATRKTFGSGLGAHWRHNELAKAL